DGPDFVSILALPNGHAIARTAVLHELGHLVGLAHVADPTQVMYPGGSAGVTGEYASGDLAGLARLGQAACVPPGCTRRCLAPARPVGHSGAPWRPTAPPWPTSTRPPRPTRTGPNGTSSRSTSSTSPSSSASSGCGPTSSARGPATRPLT